MVWHTENGKIYSDDEWRQKQDLESVTLTGCLSAIFVAVIVLGFAAVAFINWKFK